LKSCRLSEDFAHDGVTFRKGARIDFDPDGRVTLDSLLRERHKSSE
jgi:hypothetical protein